MTDNQPLVSAIMPVHAFPNSFRRRLILSALECYTTQDYPNKQLVVIDDSPEPLYDLFEDLSGHGLIYYRPELALGERMSIGDKRNMACEAASGDIILHMDSDDLSAPDRISRQVHHLVSSGKRIVGYHTFFLFDIHSRQAYRYHHSPQVCCGASLCYWRKYWEGHRFPDQDAGEDMDYCIQANGKIKGCVDGGGSLVALVHGDNTSTQTQIKAHPREFPQISIHQLPDWIWRFHSDVLVGYDSTAAVQ